MRYYEDLHTGQVLTTSTVRLDKAEMVRFAERFDPYPFHVDERAAEDSIFGGLTATSAYLFAVFTRLTHELNPKVAVQAVVQQELSYPQAGRPGDEVCLRTEVGEKRLSLSRRDRGVVRFTTHLVNQCDESILIVQATILVALRSSA